jgi:ABC-type dipeptide/oligopeptide/nickel transport system ATPase subunit
MELLRNKYSPLLINELEDSHYINEIITKLNNNDNFCVCGSTGCGKTTIILTILKNMNIDYVYIHEYQKTLSATIANVSKNTVMSYFNCNKSVLVFDNFYETIYENVNQKCIFISKVPIKTLSSIFITSPSSDYLYSLMKGITFIENKNNIVHIEDHSNYHTFYSELECAISTSKNIKIEYLFKPNKSIHKELYSNITLKRRFEIADKIDDYNIFQNSCISGIETIDSIASAMESISLSCLFEKTKYYSILGLVVPSTFITKPVKECYINKRKKKKIMYVDIPKILLKLK